MWWNEFFISNFAALNKANRLFAPCQRHTAMLLRRRWYHIRWRKKRDFSIKFSFSTRKCSKGKSRKKSNFLNSECCTFEQDENSFENYFTILHLQWIWPERCCEHRRVNECNLFIWERWKFIANFNFSSIVRTQKEIMRKVGKKNSKFSSFCLKI